MFCTFIAIKNSFPEIVIQHKWDISILNIWRQKWGTGQTRIEPAQIKHALFGQQLLNDKHSQMCVQHCDRDAKLLIILSLVTKNSY